MPSPSEDKLFMNYESIRVENKLNFIIIQVKKLYKNHWFIIFYFPTPINVKNYQRMNKDISRIKFHKVVVETIVQYVGPWPAYPCTLPSSGSCLLCRYQVQPDA